MEDWTEEEVKAWLTNVVQFPAEIIRLFEDVDGFTLMMYKKADLIDDFKLTAGNCRKLLYRRDDHLEMEGERSAQRSTPSSPVSTDESNVAAEQLVHPTSQLSLEDEAVPPAHSPDPNCNPSLGEAKDKQDVAQVREIAEVLESTQLKGSDMDDLVDIPTKSEPGIHHVEKNMDSPSSSPRGTRQKMSKVSPTSEENEKRLTKLLLGTDKGKLDSSYYPVLVVNTPSDNLNTEKAMEDKFGFMSSVNWNVVFDCNADSNTSGLCHYVHESKPIKILSPERFAETKDVDVLREGIDFPEIPVWVFPNGRHDLQERIEDKLSDMDWMRERSNAVLNTVRFFSDPGVIPPGRAVVVFLLLSSEDAMVMAQIFREFYTSKSFQDLRHFTVIAENPEVMHEWITYLDAQKLVASKNMSDRCLSGVSWQEVSTYMLRLLGTCETRLPEMPMSPKGNCQLMKKHQSMWSDIAIVAKNECENTSMDESNLGFLDFVHEKESRFYQGHEVDWWNFYLSDERLNNGRGFNHVLERKSFKTLHSHVQKEVFAPQGKRANHISMVTVFHEPGSGGTTVAKNVLWKLHRDFRCAVINRLSNDTVNQIMAFRRYGYEQSANPGRVVLLLENQDSESMRLFLVSLERETSYIRDDGLAFLLIHCKRTNEPEKLQKIEENKQCVAVQHKLTTEESIWFKQKTEELEERNVFSEKYSPELLLAFMVMKTECNPTYLKNVVKGILPNITENSSKELQNAVNLLKYISAVHMYNPDFAMPVSACDGFMQKQYRVSSSGLFQQTYGPWEKQKTKVLDLLLIEEYIQDIDGCVKGLSIVHPTIAKEIVHQLGEHFQQTPADMILELMEKSTILDTLSHSKGYIQKVCRDLMVRRLKKEYGDDKQTDFAPFIEEVYKEDKDKAFKIMEVGVQKFKDPFIAQQKARLHSKYEENSEKAEQAINAALGLLVNNSYLWDTKGIILRQKMDKFEHKETHELITDQDMKVLLEIFEDSCSAFQTAQKVMEEETTRHNYAGFVGEIFTIIKFLEIVQKRVKPFCFGRTGQEELRRYLTTEYVPPELKLQSILDHGDTMKGLSDRVDKGLSRFTDYLVQCAQQRFGNTRYRILDDKLEIIYVNRSKFFAVSSRLKGNVNNPPETAFAMRRSEVKKSHADGYQNIFEMAAKKKIDELKHVLALLRPNLQGPNLFDVKNIVFASFALSTCSNKDFDEEELRRLVNLLKDMEDRIGGFYGLFFEMLLNWPDRTSRVGTRPIASTIQELRNRWQDMYGNKHSDEAWAQNLPRRSKIRQHARVMKPTTEFYLGESTGKSKLVHRKAIGRVTYAIWKEELIKKRLTRLEGSLDNKHFVLYNPKGGESVKISLSLPIKGLPSQEPVWFYLGFSFAGPVAYDVTYKDRETPFVARETFANYPGYINDIDEAAGSTSIIDL